MSGKDKRPFVHRAREDGAVVAAAASAPGRLLKMSDLERETSLSESTIRRRIREGSFPAGKHIGGGRVVWPERDVDAWKERVLTAAD